MNLLFWLLVGHALADYPLQGDFAAKAKNHRDGVPGVPWTQALAAHSLIQGGFVAALTGSVTLGLAETVAHAAIDYAKSAGWFGSPGLTMNFYDANFVSRRAFHIDQALHVLCKVAWAAIVVLA